MVGPPHAYRQLSSSQMQFSKPRIYECAWSFPVASATLQLECARYCVDYLHVGIRSSRHLLRTQVK